VRVAIAAVLGLILALAFAAPAPAATRASLPDIEDEVMCPICGTLLQLSDAPQAERERAFIRERIDRGESKEEIKDALVAEYGPDVLAIPDDEGFDLAAWLVPALGLLAAALAIFLGLRRWRRQTPGGSPPPSGPAPGSAEDRRLSGDLARYDL
jgi:cytochrome c-type biogenesis protein CcmH